jgi:hypothetical protein
MPARISPCKGSSCRLKFQELVHLTGLGKRGCTMLARRRAVPRRSPHGDVLEPDSDSPFTGRLVPDPLLSSFHSTLHDGSYVVRWLWDLLTSNGG